MDRKLLYQTVLQLSEADYIDFMQSVHLDYQHRSKELTNKITNYWKREEGKMVKRNAQMKSGTSTEETRAGGRSSGPGSNLVSSLPKPSSSLPESSSCDSASGRKQEASSLMPWQKSAWKTGFIFRGDKVPINGRVFIDVEKVTMRKQHGARAHAQKAATICLVNSDGKVVLWAFIKRDHEQICQYAPRMTNLNRQKLNCGVTLEMVHTCLKICLDGNEVVGVSVLNDLASLDYTHHNTLELQHFFKDAQGNGFGLAHIAQKLLTNRSGFQAGHHYAIDDARMTLAVYKKLVELQSIPGALMKCCDTLAASRNEFKKSRPMMFSEKCTCSK